MIAYVNDLLMREDVQLLTLTGPGGSGKTRLAVEVVGRIPAGRGDTWFVSLAAVRDPDLVVSAIAQAVGVRQVSGRPIEEILIGFLRDRNALLVIDNFETVVAASVDVARILRACPGITMLVTSRIALRISGEHVVVVPPLGLPHPTHAPLSIDRLRSIESVRLFRERAKASATTFELTDDNASVVVDICRRLDGLPLALELAAARCGMLSPAALLRLLDHQTGLLSGGPRDAPDRHKSMRSAIAWSYDLLTEHEQAVFRRLAVFSGGFSLPAAETVVDLPVNILDAVASLAAKSLIVPIQSNDPEPRFTMLETLREFGLERLSAEGEAGPARERHASFFLQEAIEGEFAWCMYLSDGLRWLNRLVADRANMRDALVWLEERGDISTCLRLAGALGTLWVVCSDLHEGHTWLGRLLDDSRGFEDPARGNALATLSWISNHRGEPDRAFALAAEGLRLFRAHDDRMGTARCLMLCGIAAEKLGTLEMAIQRHVETLELLGAMDGPDWLQNWIISEQVQLGIVEFLRGDVDLAASRFDEAVRLDHARGYEPGTSHIYGNYVMGGLGLVARARGNVALALHCFQQHLRIALCGDNINAAVHTLGDIAGTLAASGQRIAAARLFGATAALHSAYGYDFVYTSNLQRVLGLPEPWDTVQHFRDALAQHSVSPLTPSSSTGALADAWDEGRALSLDEAVTEALAATASPEKDVTPDPGHDLTPRQMEVLRLVVDGLSNRAIAETLSLSERTVEHHIMHILDRLGAESRTAAATYAVRGGLV